MIGAPSITTVFDVMLPTGLPNALPVNPLIFVNLPTFVPKVQGPPLPMSQPQGLSGRELALPTPVKANALFSLLSGYNPSTAAFLHNSFTKGFSVQFHSMRQSRESHKLVSAIQNPLAVDAKLDKELGAHRRTGPFRSPPFISFLVSPGFGT